MSGVNNGSNENVTIEDRNYSVSYDEVWADYIELIFYTDLDKLIIPIIMPIVVIIGVIGNLLTIIVIARKKCMHTPVNRYFANLAIADALFLITAPDLKWNSYVKSPLIDFIDIGEVPNWVCPLHTFLVNVGIDVAFFTIFWLSVERYIAVCRPLKFKQSFGSCSRSIKICGIIWFLGLSWNVYILVKIRKDIGEVSWPLIAVDILPNFITYCRGLEHSDIHWYASGARYFVMIVIIVALYTAMLMSLRKSRSIVTSSAGRESKSKAELKVFLTVFITVTCHVLGLTPVYITLTLIDNGIELNHSYMYIFVLMAYINSSVNPVIYNAMNYKFRRAFCDVYCSRCIRKKNTPINVQIQSLQTKN